MARFDEDTNKKLIAAKNKSNRSKSHEVGFIFVSRAHLSRIS
ncbi:TraY domain-containing protein [Klebsiella quasipneumoniae]|nr:TraY domain-containing protein [Klebsiella quasipneumoniae]UDC46964.1 TraY domain-containing protein [Klebsiella quasipneumoniae subsp. similipneumoniae]